MRSSAGVVAILVTFAIYGQCSAFENTNKLLSSLDHLHGDATTSLQCFNDMEAPRVRVGEFVTDTVGIYDGLTVLNARCGTINTVASALLLVPGVNIIGAKVLIPLTTSLTYLARAISLAQTGVEPIVNAMRHWEDPIHHAGQVSHGNIQLLSSVQTAAYNGKNHLQLVAGEIAQVVCGDKRSGLLGNIESAASGMDGIPIAASAEIQRAHAFCVEVEGFFAETDGKIDTSVTTVLSVAKDGIDIINSGFDPIQKYIDEVDKVLDTELCAADVARIIAEEIGVREEDVSEVVDTVIDAGETVVDTVKEVFRGWRRRRRAVERAAMDKLLRQKRDICLTVRKILDGTIAVTSDYTAAAEFLLREVFNNVMPGVPELTQELENLAATLLPFQIDFDLQTRSNAMILNPVPINNFLAIDYVQTFWERPTSSDLSGSSQTCPSETALIVV